MIDPHCPCIVVLSNFINPETLIKEILKEDVLPEPSILDEAKMYPWKIETKYYIADVNICPIENDILYLPEALSSLVEGLIVYFDARNKDSFENVIKWSESLNICPEILLLVCDSFKDIPTDGVTRSTALNWCLENGYELIELQDTEVQEDDYNDIIPDLKGVERVIEALHTHTWSNLDMKNNTGTNSLHHLDLEDDTEDFCELFSQLHSMKESIQSLPARDRRTCAEQVVTTFWKAIGGDEDEIEDILP